MGILVGVLMGQIRFFTYVLDPVVELFRPIPPDSADPTVDHVVRHRRTIAFLHYLVGDLLHRDDQHCRRRDRNAADPCSRRSMSGGQQGRDLLGDHPSSALPYVLTGMRIGFGFAFSGLVAAEMIAAQSGVGFLIMQSRAYIQTDQMFVGLLTLALVGMLSDRIFRWVIARTMRRYMQYLYNV